MLFLIFIPRAGIHPQRRTVIPRDGTRVTKDATESGYRKAVLVVAITIIHLIITFIICVVTLARFPRSLQSLANVLGILSAILACVQYLPQIQTTWRLQHIGSLSIPMMLIQTPGAFVFAASLAARLGIAGWSTWSVYIVTGLLQGCLLVMGLKFERRDRREGANGVDHAGQRLHVDHEGERAPLLNEEVCHHSLP